MSIYTTHVPSARATPQSVQAEPAQVPNSAGGFSFTLDHWAQLDRFLILGTAGGTYYISEQKLTRENAKAVEKCIADDGARTVARILEISHAGRAPKNSPAIFALAMAAGLGNAATKAAALDAMPKVCRIGTHLFEFLQAVKLFRGWGPALRRAVAKWYLDRPVENMAQQMLKYRNRAGWGHHDVAHLAHIKTEDPQRNALFKLAKVMASGHDKLRAEGVKYDGSLPLVEAFLKLQEPSTSEKDVAKLIADTPGITFEMLPSEAQGRKATWEALIENDRLPFTALIRNLGRMTANGTIAAGNRLQAGSLVGKVIAKLADVEGLRKARVHPVAVLAALLTYKAGHGTKGSLTWTPVGDIIDALDTAFYAAFGTLAPTGKKFLLGLDVSGSMGVGEVAGVPGLTPLMASAAMAMTIARVEPNHHFMGFSHQLVPLPITPRQRLDDVMATMARVEMGATDCALPMLVAARERWDVDCFVTLTDSETWFGTVHPHQALRAYRQSFNGKAKNVVVGMVANSFTIADPSDAGEMDVVGFDAAVPQLISDFASAGFGG